MTENVSSFHESDVRSTYRFLAHPGRGVTEVRVISPGRGVAGIGYFDNEEAFVDACNRANGRGNVYVGIQPRPLRLIEQAPNRVGRLRSGARDDDIEWLTAVVIDIDPERPKHTAATEEELGRALACGEQISAWATGEGFVPPVRNMSGNGCQLWFAVPPCQVSAENRETVTAGLKGFEAEIRERFKSDGVAIDSIYNLSRIIKVIGTKSVKGQPTVDRPHRLSACLGTFDRQEDDALLAAIQERAVAPELEDPAVAKKAAPVAIGSGISERVLGLLSAHPKLTALFEGRGKTALGTDGQRLDGSSSGYDFSLAVALASKGVTDPNELATALWYRADGGAREKGQSYIERTVRHVLERAQASAAKRTKPTPSSGGEADPDLPTIVINDRELRDVTSDALSALMRANDPPAVFQRGTMTTRIQTTDSGLHRLEPYIQSSMRGRLGRVANWRKEVPTREGDIRSVSVSPPLDVVQDILSLPSWPFPSIEGVVEAPVFAANGELMTRAGYHPDARLWIHLDEGITIPDVSDYPSDAEVARARTLLLDELLAEFPFVDAASRANALAALLLPFVRTMIDGPTPLHLIDAPAPGTGKSLLADAICLPSTGRPAVVMTEGRDDDEWRKRITAAISQASVFLLLDNIRRRLDSSQLSAAITATTWTDRILGRTATAVLPVKVIWLATANNVALSNEIARRCVWIRLDAKVDQPWMRSGFRHADLRAWAKRRRGEIVWAALTLGRAWRSKGSAPGRQRLGNFEAWVQTLGGILEAAGVPGFMGNAQEFYARSDDETAEWRAFVLQWWERHRETRVQVQDLFQLATEAELLASVLGDKGERSQKIRLGKALGRMRDRVVGDYRIDPAGHDKSARSAYRLCPTDREAARPATTLPLFGDEARKTSANLCPNKVDVGASQAGKTSADLCERQKAKPEHNVNPADVGNEGPQMLQMSDPDFCPDICQPNGAESQGLADVGRGGRSISHIPLYNDPYTNLDFSSRAHALRSRTTYATSADGEKAPEQQQVESAEVAADVGQKWQMLDAPRQESTATASEEPGKDSEKDWEVFEI